MGSIEYLKRSEPPKDSMLELILRVTGGNYPLITSTYCGLVEAPPDGIDLGLNKIIVWGAATRKLREDDINSFADFVKSADIYDVFKEVYKIGFPWLNKYKEISKDPQLNRDRGISEELEQLYNNLNPENNLEQSVRKVDSEALKTLKQNLQYPVKRHLFKSQYPHLLERVLRDKGIAIIPLSYPLKGKGVINQFSSLVTRMILNYLGKRKFLDNMNIIQSI
jgi:hypothetical protein|tara:strand:+ start:9864 stop:10529 length:666 start_codon:yes stop_codon:yes gene_type:complete